jgi:anaerobic selenocysteine-containing dehydrogenase
MSSAPFARYRRRFIKLFVAGASAAPLASTLLSRSAQAAEPVTEANPTAAALGYKEDASKATKRTDTKATCANCNLYTGKAGAADGPCGLFGGNLVKAKGWCTAWVKKP